MTTGNRKGIAPTNYDSLTMGNGEIALGCYKRQGTTRYGGIVWGLRTVSTVIVVFKEIIKSKSRCFECDQHSKHLAIIKLGRSSY